MKRIGFVYMVFLYTSALLCAQDPTWDWAISLHTVNPEIATDVVADPASGNAYMVGNWSGSLAGSITAGTSPSTNFASTYGQNDGIVAKFSPSGNLLWAFKVGGDDDDQINAIHLDRDGNFYITGSVSAGDIQFAGTASLTTDSTYTNLADNDFFLSKYDGDGQLLWYRHSDGNDNIEGRGIASNASGIYVTGMHKGNVSFGLLPPYSSVGDEDMFIVKYTTDGDEQWHISGGSDKHDYGEDIICDETYLYVVGEFEGDALNLTNPAGDVLTSIPNTDDSKTEIFIASYGQAGDLQWSGNVASPDDDYCLGITMDSDTLYLAGSFGAPALFPGFAGNPVSHADHQDAFICSMSKTDGITGWVATLTGESGDEQVARDISIDVSGNLYATGYFKNTLNTPVDNLFSVGSDDIFMVSYSNNGQYRWVKTAGSASSDVGNGLSAASSGEVFLAGDYGDVTSFDAIVLPNDGSRDLFLAKLKLPCNDAVSGVLSVTETAICESDAIGLLLTGYMGDIQWQTSPPGMDAWNLLTADLSDSIVFVPAASADYRAYLTSGTCSPDFSNVVNVQLDSMPVPDPGSGGDVCGLVFALQAIPSVGTGFWSLKSGPGTAVFLPDSADPAAMATVSEFGNYEFRWSETTGSCTSDSSVVVRFFEQPVIALIPGAKTCGLEFRLNATTNTDAIGTWTIMNGPGNALFLPDESTPDARVQADTHGTYAFQWTALNVVCSQSAVVDVEFMKVPDTDAGVDDTIEIGEVIRLNGTGGDSVIWTPDYRLSDPNIPDPLADPLVSTTYHLNVISLNGCNAKDSVVITVKPPDFAEAGMDVSICPGDSTQLFASGGDLYKWDPSDGLDQPDIPDPWAKPRVTTNYIVSVTRSDGITDRDTVTVTILPRPFVNAGEPQSICLGEPAQLSATGTGAFRWSPAVYFSDPSLAAPEVTVDTTTTFRVRITDSDGCRNADTVTVFVFHPPVADAGPDQEYIALFETVLEASLAPDETGLWSVVSGFGIFEFPQAPDTRVYGLEIGNNVFEWQVTNEGCPAASDQIDVRVNDFVIPTVITPNGDGKNDYFHVEGIESYKSAELIILNRWGEVVYHALPYQNQWDGVNQNGKELLEDTYYTILKLSENDIRKGYVMIIR